jgi:hypothetical protein
MRKIAAIILFFASISWVLGQEVKRTVVTGKIQAMGNEDVEGIALFDISSQQGTVTDSQGYFELEMAPNDKVYIAALQFQPFTIVIDEGIIDSKSLTISLNPAINELDEVVVSPYSLTGNLRVDVSTIPIEKPKLEVGDSKAGRPLGYDIGQDGQTHIYTNAAEYALNNQGMQNGLNVKNILLELAGLFSNVDSPSNQRLENLPEALRQRFNENYLAVNLGILPEHMGEFIYFVGDNGLDPELLAAENELRLAEHLFEQSQRYKKQIQAE